MPETPAKPEEKNKFRQKGRRKKSVSEKVVKLNKNNDIIILFKSIFLYFLSIDTSVIKTNFLLFLLVFTHSSSSRVFNI